MQQGVKLWSLSIQIGNLDDSGNIATIRLHNSPATTATKLQDHWAFHPILLAWFLVVFGNEVTKILRNSLFTFLLSKARQAKREHMEMKISQPIFVILVTLMKNKVTKI